MTIAVDSAVVCAMASAPFSCSWNTKTTGNGSHTIKATAKDAAGNQALSSAAVAVSNAAADTTAPIVAITSPAAGSTISGNVTVTVSYSDNVGVTRVDLLVDGTLTATAASAPFTTRWNSRKAAPGAHALQVKACDAAGNCGLSSPPITVYTAR